MNKHSAALVAATLLCTAPAARAQEKLPDLVVTDVRVSPDVPLAGDVVRLSAVVKNQGTAPTPEGVVLGGVFRVNGQVFAFTDQYKHTLAPGESVTLTASGGGASGNGTWTPQAGAFTLGFLIDDVNRVRESDEKNNDFTGAAPLTIRAFNGPDLTVKQVTWERRMVGKQTRTVLTALVANRGTAATPANLPLAVRFTLDGEFLAQAQIKRALASGTTAQIISAPVAIPDGKHALIAEVDPARTVAERRADNNRLRRDLWQNVRLTLTPKPSDAFADSIGVCTH